MAEERLHKTMAAAGIASRRACEEMIVDGLVTVNGHTVTELGVKVDPEKDRIVVDGKPLRLPERHIYIKLHKPRGVLSDLGGETGGRQTVADLLPADLRRVFPVGRLDLNSEGLVLMTDDGDLAHKLTHPRFQHPKTYFVLTPSRLPIAVLEQLRNGVDLPEGRSAPARVRMIDSLPPQLLLGSGPTEGVWVEFVLREGKKRQIRHMMAAVGRETLRLVRWAIGPLELARLKAGEHAILSRQELESLRAEAGGPRAPQLPIKKTVAASNRATVARSSTAAARSSATSVRGGATGGGSGETGARGGETGARGGETGARGGETSARGSTTDARSGGRSASGSRGSAAGARGGATGPKK